MLGYPGESQHKPEGVLTARVDETEGGLLIGGPGEGLWLGAGGHKERGNCSDSIKSRRRCHELTGEMIAGRGSCQLVNSEHPPCPREPPQARSPLCHTSSVFSALSSSPIPDYKYQQKWSRGRKRRTGGFFIGHLPTQLSPWPR